MNIFSFLALTALGLTGNYFKFAFFFNVDFIFGSIFAEVSSLFQHITSDFAIKLSSKFVGLTKKELEIAARIKEGKSTKDIQSMLGISKATVDSHRDHIRKKLGMKNSITSLRSYLVPSINSYLSRPARKPQGFEAWG